MRNIEENESKWSRSVCSPRVSELRVFSKQSDLKQFQNQLQSYQQYFTQVLEKNEGFKQQYCRNFQDWSSKRDTSISKLKSLETYISTSNGIANTVSVVSGGLCFAGHILSLFAKDAKSADNIRKGSRVLGLVSAGSIAYKALLSEHHSKEIEGIIQDEEKSWNDLIKGYEDSVKRCEAVKQKLDEVFNVISNIKRELWSKMFSYTAFVGNIPGRVMNLLSEMESLKCLDVGSVQYRISGLIKDIEQQKFSNSFKEYFFNFCYEILKGIQELLPILEKVNNFATVGKYNPCNGNSKSALEKLKIWLAEPNLAVKDVIIIFENEKKMLLNVKNKLSTNERMIQRKNRSKNCFCCSASGKGNRFADWIFFTLSLIFIVFAINPITTYFMENKG